MKYTAEQKIQLKNKGMKGFTKYDRFIPVVKIVDGYFIVESKMNYKINL